MTAAVRIVALALLLAVAGCAQSVAGAGPGSPAPTATAPSAVASTLIPAGADPAGLVGKTWYLTTVTRHGRTWSPLVVSTLVFDKDSGAVTFDGSNHTTWQVALGARTVDWKQLESEAGSEQPTSWNVSGALWSELKGATPWSLAGDTLTFHGADAGVLTFSTTAPTAPEPTSGALVFLDNDPPGGKEGRGQDLNLIQGQVSIMDGAGVVRWQGLVASDDAGDSQLAPGSYTVTAVVQGGTCTPLPITVVVKEVSEFTLVCTTTQPTMAQH